MKVFGVLFAVVFVSLAPIAAHAHGGGLDANGCHNDLKHGGYHCHRGPLAGQSFGSRYEAEAALSKQSTPQAVAAPTVARQITGVASVVDGDTIDIHGQRIRFHGIDAPESSQLCKDAQGKNYRCGQKAALALSDQIGRKIVTCEQKDIDRYKRIVATCSVGDVNLNGWMVENGHAMAYRQYGGRTYDAQETKAKAEKVGIWQGDFTPPWDWRKTGKN